MIDPLFVLVIVVAFGIVSGLRRRLGLEWLDHRPRWARAIALAPLLLLIILNNR